MIQADWKRISGIHIEDDGLLGAVWIAYDRHADCVHLYDACLFRREVLAVIAEGLNARGRWLPVAWEKRAKAMADKLSERGCNMLYEPHEATEAVSEVISKDIEARMRTGRFKVEKRLAEWLDEYKSFFRQEQKVPEKGFPLMSATRNAVAMMDEWGRAEKPAGSGRLNHPQIAVV